jgi:hypothetical protein
VRLYINILGPKQFSASLHGELFHPVHVYAAGMEPSARISFNGLGVEHGPRNFENGLGRVIFSGNQINGVLQPLFFLNNQLSQFRIVVGKMLHGENLVDENMRD